jgi:UDP-3-O-[3-hydroxymyristoyl] glucosamine N-acyltransferase
MTDVTVGALAQLVSGRVVGDPSRRIVGLGDLRTAGPDRIGFVRETRYQSLAKDTRAGAVLTAVELATPASQIVVADVDVAYARVASHFHPVPRATEHAIHATAVVDPEAELEPPVAIGPQAVVGRCRIGAGTVVAAGVVIGDRCVIGRDCHFYPHVTLYPDVQVGNRVILHANAVIGGDGFGYAREGAEWIKVPQLGSTVLDDDVEIGAGSAVDRATLGATRVGARTKIDNLCHIAHNCTIGADCVMAAGVGIAGSTAVGDRCVFAGNVGISGHLKIGSDVRLGGGTIVLKDIPDAGDYMGHPVMLKRRFLRLLRVLRGLVPGRGDAE